MWSTAVTRALGIELPIVVAPMGGGPSTPPLVAAASNGGALGSLAAGYLPPDRVHAEIAATRALTARSFAVNVFVGSVPPADPAAVERALTRLEPLRAQLGLPPRPAVDRYAEDLDAQLEVIAAARPAVVSFTFGLLPEHWVQALHDAGCVLVGTATTVDEAVALERSGTDVVCAQGAEAGAHHGTFLGDPFAAVVGTMALVPQVCDAVRIPVIAAGGIMDGRGVAAALALGAGAVQMGTAFLRCPEAGTSLPYRSALAAATERDTVLTVAVTGRIARGIQNRLMRELADLEVPGYPIMNALTSELRREAARQGDADLLALWCGQGVRLGTERPARELLHAIATEARAVLRQRAADLPAESTSTDPRGS